LADDIEIIPVDVPTRMPVLLDPAGELQTALDNRSEIVEAKLGIDSARIQVGAAKNQSMPQLDVIFRYAVDGLGGSQHDAFDEVSKHDFTEYLFGLEFEIPIGNRRARAALKAAELTYSQAIAGLKQAYEQVMLDVNIAVREVQVTYDQIEPNFQSAEASADQVESIQLRAENQNFLTLNNELNARQALAQARADLLGSMIDYGIALIDLERAKGTLLRYNNINLVFDESEDPAN
jgi:outer membrane protein TolC